MKATFVLVSTLVLGLLISILWGCGTEDTNSTYSSSVCITVPNTEGVMITCPGSAPFQINNGLVGAQGIAGSTVTTVQFCPQYTTTYPSTFAEVGFCIGNELFAEYYSPPSSGLTLLPPGLYQSTQTGAPCNFTVVQGCQIQ